MDNDKLWAAVDKMLQAENGEGKLTLQVRDAILLAGMQDLKSAFEKIDDTLTKRVAEIEKRLDPLERKNLIIWAEKHPKAALTVTGALILIAMFLHEISPFLRPLLRWFGLPVEL